MKEIEVTYGSKIVDDYGKVSYRTGSTFNGWCFKDREAFEKGEGVCYISEYAFQDMQDELASLDIEYDQTDMTENEYNEQRNDIIRCYGWTRDDILALAGWDERENERHNEIATGVAEIIFDIIDWQSPDTYYNEMELEDFAEDLKLTDEEIEEWC